MNKPSHHPCLTAISSLALLHHLTPLHPVSILARRHTRHCSISFSSNITPILTVKLAFLRNFLVIVLHQPNDRTGQFVLVKETSTGIQALLKDRFVSLLDVYKLLRCQRSLILRLFKVLKMASSAISLVWYS